MTHPQVFHNPRNMQYITLVKSEVGKWWHAQDKMGPKSASTNLVVVVGIVDGVCPANLNAQYIQKKTKLINIVNNSNSGLKQASIVGNNARIIN